MIVSRLITRKLTGSRAPGHGINFRNLGEPNKQLVILWRSATKLITLAKAGERNPNKLCEEVVKDISTPQQWAASEAARSSGLSDYPRDLMVKVILRN
jgi:hypothetical protein